MGASLGCQQEDDFVEEYAAEVCRMVRDCGRELRLPGETEVLPSNASCEAQVEAHYASCGDGCRFVRRKARRCLRRLRDNECRADDDSASNDGADESIPFVCSSVYAECAGGEDESSMCRAPTGCSVGGTPGEGSGMALGLLALGLGLRRRRR